MDVSPEYVKMCEKAEEIQTAKVQYFQQHGNFFADSITPTPTWLISCDICFDLTQGPNRCIWLPRQDQLQEMIHSEYDPYFGAMLTHLMNFYNKIQSVYLTMEQLWLAFVMKEKYNKTWNGTDWK